MRAIVPCRRAVPQHSLDMFLTPSDVPTERTTITSVHPLVCVVMHGNTTPIRHRYRVTTPGGRYTVLWLWAQRFQRVCNAESAQRWPRCLRAGWLRARGVAQFLHAEGSCARACGPRWSRVRCQTAGCTPVCLAQPDLPAVVFERSELLCGVCVCQTRMFLWPRHPFGGKWRLGWRHVARLRARV